MGVGVDIRNVEGSRGGKSRGAGGVKGRRVSEVAGFVDGAMSLPPMKSSTSYGCGNRWLMTRGG